MGPSGTLTTALLGFACFAGALHFSAGRAEDGLEAVGLMEDALDGQAATAGEGTASGALGDVLTALAPADAQVLAAVGRAGAPLAAATSSGAPSSRDQRSGPWPPFVDAEPAAPPRNLRVQLVDGASALQSLEHIEVIQRSGGTTEVARAYRLSEDEPTLFGVGSPGLRTGAAASFEVRAVARGETLVGAFTLPAVPDGVEITLEAPVVLVAAGSDG